MLRFILHKNFTVRSAPIDQDTNDSWLQISAVVILSTYVYAFCEWLFFITQPSYTADSCNRLISVSFLLFSGSIIAGERMSSTKNIYLLTDSAEENFGYEQLN